MKLEAAFFWLVLLFSSHTAYSQPSRIFEVEALTTDQIWDGLVTIDSNGFTVFGKCRVAEATLCPSCACAQYFRTAQQGTMGLFGWPKNPLTGDATGCLTGCWNGSTTSMCTQDKKANVKAMLLDALDKNACGPTNPPVNTGQLTVRDSSRFHFVDPSASCSKGKIICAATGIAADVVGLTQFTRMPDKICRAALTTAKKMKGTKIQYITCEEFGAKHAANEKIREAASMVGQLNQSYSLFEMAGLQKFLDSNAEAYMTMTTEDVALFYVAVQKDVSRMPSNIRFRIEPSNFTKFRAPGEDFITQDEINKAELNISEMSQNRILGNTLDVSGALEYFKKKD